MGVRVHLPSEFRDAMTLVSRTQDVNAMTKVLGKFWQPTMIEALCALVLSLLASGHVMWWLERKRNQYQFPDSYLDGVDDGIWWSFVTMTTGASACCASYYIHVVV